MRLADFIDSHLDEILNEWDSFAATRLPSAAKMDFLALRDHAPQILSAISADMRRPQTAAAQYAKSLGLADDLLSVAQTAAEVHGALRAQDGFSITQVVSEYRALRASVLRLWIPGDHSPPEATAVNDVMRFNEAMDQAIAESVDFFSQQSADDRLGRAAVERELQLNRGRLEYASRLSNVGFWYCDLPFDVLEWDDRVKEHFFLKPSARVTIDDFYDRIHQDDRERTRSAIEMSIGSREAYDIVYRTVCPVTGEVKWIRALGGTDYADDGSPIHFDGLTVDVTEQKLIERRIAESEVRHRGVIANMDEAFVLFDRDFNIIEANEATCQLVRIPRPQLIGSNHWQQFPGTYESELGETYRQVLLDGEPRFLEHRYVFQDGRAAWFEVRAFKVGSGIAVLFRDVTERVELIRALKDAEKRQSFQLRMADTLSDQADARALILAASQLVGAYFKADRVGYALVDLGAQTVNFEQDWTRAGFGSLAGQEQPLERLGSASLDELRAGQVLVIDDVGTDPRSQPFAVSYASIGVKSIVATPLRNEEQLAGIFYLHVGESRAWLPEETALIEDAGHRIAEAVKRIRAEDQLRDESSILELLNKTGQSLNSMLDFDALLQSITDAATKISGAEFGAFFYNGHGPDGDALMLYTLSGAPREAFERFGHPRPTPVFSPTFQGQGPVRSNDITKDPRYGRMAPHHGMPAGHLPVVSYLAVSVASRSGEVLGGLFFGHSQPGKFTERTERIIEGIAAQAASAIDNARLYEKAQRSAEDRETLLQDERVARAEAERLARAKDEFLAMLAHELRNPLAPVSVAAEILKRSPHDQERIARASEIITRQVGHLKHLINDLMDVSRVTRGLVDLHREHLDIKTLVSTAIEQVKPLIEARQHTLNTRIEGDHAEVFGDRTRLIQVVANLLNNAAKYTPPAGEITLHITVEGKFVSITVLDNGLGIDSDILPHVFELFTQGSRSLDRTQGGLGIGLALVKAIVDLHDGQVQAYSAGRSKGSRFTVSLPTIEQRKVPEQGDRAETNGDALRIMVVDDNVDAAESLGVLLRALGHEVTVEYDATNALATAANLTPHAFILDIGLPNISGYELASKLRQIPEVRSATLIALTGYGQAQDRAAAIEAGFDHHMVKPADIQHLTKILSMVRVIPLTSTSRA